MPHGERAVIKDATAVTVNRGGARKVTALNRHAINRDVASEHRQRAFGRGRRSLQKRGRGAIAHNIY